MSISSAIKSASSRWLSWRSECRCGAWHPEIISPCGASPVAPEVGRFQTPPAPPCCARRVKRRVRRYGCFQLVRQQCRQLCNASERFQMAKAIAPRPVTRESAQSASCSACQWRNALLLPPAKGHMTRCAVLPFRAGHSGMHIADCVTAPPYHHRCRNRLTGRGAAVSGV